MTVTLKCDICKQEIILEPGDISIFIGNGKGWNWYRPSSFGSPVVILPETICEKCDRQIKIAKHNAEVQERERLSAQR